MSDIQVLKEIAFYSKLIEQQKKFIWKKNINNKYIAKPPSTLNKYKYVKKEDPVQKEVTNKILINPNFKQKVLVNPHFKKNSKIHVNPKVLNANINGTEISKQTEQLQKNQAQNSVDRKTPLRHRRLSVHSKYKIVKSSNNFVKSFSSIKSPTVKSKYKIDRRSINTINKNIIKKKVTTHGISDIMRHKVFTNRIWKKTVIISKFKLRNVTNNVSYKKPQIKLQEKPINNKNKKSLVVINGQRYAVAMNKKSLKRLSSSNKSIKLVKKPAKISPKLKNKHLSKKQKIQQLRKNNLPCPVYQRYGKCRRKQLNRCYFLHNPKQIFLCKKFLQGACIDKDCLLSHKVSAEKMPTCKYFLDGCCVKSDCPYLHVKINPKAGICRKFLEGFCEKGIQCNLRHQFLCPNFEKNGTCPKRKCIYPHKNKTEIEKPKAKIRLETNGEKLVESGENKRYYTDKSESNEQVNINNEIINENLFSDDDGKEKPKRPQLGTLPSYIPFS